jgi:hypothetical protein
VCEVQFCTLENKLEIPVTVDFVKTKIAGRLAEHVERQRLERPDPFG